MRNTDTLLIVLFVFLPIVIVIELWNLLSSFAGLSSWARKNGFAILCREERTFFMGPFFWTTSKFQTVWRITVRDNAGQVREGWVRCERWPFAFLSSHVEVRWDEVVNPQKDPTKDRSLDV